MITTQQLHEQVTRFWELEECTGSSNRKGNSEESICEDYFCATTKRNSEGRFIVSIPFKSSLQTIGQSRNQAYRRLLTMERRLKAEETLSHEYHKFMREYETSGHMSKLSSSISEIETGYYLPHHP